MATTLLIASVVLFMVGVAIIAYDVISTRKRRDRSEQNLAEPIVRTREV